MTDEHRDLSELLRSPYDPDPGRSDREEGDSEIPWKPAVAAAVLGAVVASAFVVYAIVAGPSDELEAAPDAPTSTTMATVEWVQSDGYPDGYVEIQPNVAMRGEWFGSSGSATRVGVSTAVAGTEDPATIANPEIAFWELEATGATHRMVAQIREHGAIGNLTLEFPVLVTIREPALLAYTTVGTSGSVESFEYAPDTTVIGPLEFNVDGTTVVIDQLTIGDVYAHVAWHVTDGGLPVKIDTVVTFVGTDDPSTPDEVDATTLTSPHLRGLFQGFGVPPLPPLYGFTRSEQLLRTGEPVGAGNEAEAIIVEFTITVPSEVGDPVRIPIGPTG